MESDETVTDQPSKNNVGMPGSADWESRTRRRLTRVLVRRERKEDRRNIATVRITAAVVSPSSTAHRRLSYPRYMNVHFHALAR